MTYTPTYKEAEAIRYDVWTLKDLKDSIKAIPTTDLGKYNLERNIKRIDTLSDRILQTMHINVDIPIDQVIDSIMDKVYYVINGSNGARHLTVEDLPRVRTEKRNGYPDHYNPAPKQPGRIPKKTKAKRMAAFIKHTMDGSWDVNKREWVYPGNDSITHIATGKVWDATTGATPEEFMKVMQ